MRFINTIKQLKRNSRQVLFGNYSLLMLSTLFFITLNVGFTYLSSCFASLLYGHTTNSAVSLVGLTFMLISFIFCIPLYFGYISVIVSACRGKSILLSDLFEYYSSRAKAGEAYGCALRAFPLYFAGILLPILSGTAAMDFFAGSSANAASVFKLIKLSFGTTALVVLTVALVFLGLLMTSVAIQKIINTVSECENQKMTVIWKLLLLRLSFIPLLVISVLSFGLLFIAYTIPQIVTAYCLCLGVVSASDNDEACANTTAFAAPAFSESSAASDSGSSIRLEDFKDDSVFTTGFQNNSESKDANETDLSDTTVFGTKPENEG